MFERGNKKKDNFLDPFYNNDDDDDDDDSPPGSPNVPPPPPVDFDFDENINPYNVDLNNLEREYFARDIPIDYERQRQIQLDTNLREIFPMLMRLYMKMRQAEEDHNFFLIHLKCQMKVKFLQNLIKTKFLKN